MDHLSVLQSKGILKNADSYILTNREKRELIDAFNSLSKINKIDLPKKANFDPNDSRDIESIKYVSKNLTLKEMINLSLTDKKMREIMTPIIEDKRQELEKLRVWLSRLPKPLNYSIERLDQLRNLNLAYNQLTSFPNLNLPNLKELFLDNNQLTSIPVLSLNLPNLRYLDLNYNKLTSIPNFNLPNLKDLYLFQNKLTEFPNINLPKLQLLDLEENLLPETEKNRLKSIFRDRVFL